MNLNTAMTDSISGLRCRNQQLDELFKTFQTAWTQYHRSSILCTVCENEGERIKRSFQLRPLQYLASSPSRHVMVIEYRWTLTSKNTSSFSSPCLLFRHREKWDKRVYVTQWCAKHETHNAWCRNTHCVNRYTSHLFKCSYTEMPQNRRIENETIL